MEVDCMAPWKTKQVVPSTLGSLEILYNIYIYSIGCRTRMAWCQRSAEVLSSGSHPESTPLQLNSMFDHS